MIHFEKYVPSDVSQYQGPQITIEDLATHTSGLPEFPDNYCLSFNPAKQQQFMIQSNTEQM